MSAARAPASASAPAPLAGRPRPTLKEQAYTRIEEAIVTLELPPGRVVSESAMSEMTGIGRTPIREAIQRLAQENLIIVLPQRGLLVAEMDVRKQLRLLETRREVERLIARSAARRATAAERQRFAELAAEFEAEAVADDDTGFVRSDRDFNELCLSAARNEFAEGAMRLMHGLSRRFWYVHYKQAADLPETARLHAAIADAIARGEVEGAGRALDRLLDQMEEFTRSTVLSDL
ncbi:GntR family transcriptional regulator [Pseudazoarcus pumilus]|uniref:GntR family transcriptional regulator n=1 Tax=Pseudazoarcus pumilus TaxID=2067960 RepID=A0A2I6SA56_9RHOO|nr:GntR family transcriptional regulator [Pseudazoarcus pumilus]AUN96132.1 GntR family transcriptional regulator [Pseudazoarcus pumilus]